MFVLRLTAAAAVIVPLFLAVQAASGQDFPNKPIRIATGTPGGGSDSVARIIAQGISGPLGQPVVIDNRPSALLAEIGSKAPPDGYTLIVTGGSLWIGPLLQKMNYDAVSDFSPISLLLREVSVLAVHPSLPVKSIKELIALAKAKPGQLNYGSGAAGSPGHLGMELFKSMAGVNIVHVPYKGGLLVITALIAGEVHLTMADAGLVTPHMKSGKLRGLAVTSATPSALAPGLPTVAATLPGYEYVGITGILTAAKTPPAIVNRLNQEIVRVLNRPETKEQLLNAGEEIVASTPEVFAATIKSETAKWSKVTKDLGLKPEG